MSNLLRGRHSSAGQARDGQALADLARKNWARDFFSPSWATLEIPDKTRELTVFDEHCKIAASQGVHFSLDDALIVMFPAYVAVGATY